MKISNKKKIQVLTIGILFVSSFFFVFEAFAKTYNASGAGDSNANGTWTDMCSDVNGYPKYTNGTYFMFWNSGGQTGYTIKNNQVDSVPVIYYTQTAGQADPTGTWLPDSGQPSPAPTVTLSNGGDTCTPIEATSTVEQTQLNIGFGILFFYIAAGGIINYFSRRFKQ